MGTMKAAQYMETDDFKHRYYVIGEYHTENPGDHRTSATVHQKVNEAV